MTSKSARSLVSLTLALIGSLSLLSALPPRPAQAQAPAVTLNEPILELPAAEPMFEDVASVQEQVLARWRAVKASRRAVDATKIDELLKAAGDTLAAGYEQDHANIKQAYQQLLEAQILMMPSRPAEFRGVLIDADALGPDPAAMAKLLDRLKAAGFNAIFPEVFRRGYALFPNRVAEMDPLYRKKNIDALQEVTRLASERGLQVYPWVWTFRVFSPSASSTNPVAERLPALISPQSVKNDYASGGEGLEDESASFVSPASPEWRSLMATLVGEMAQTYAVQGFLLDYIRYGNNATSDQYSQTAFNMDYFRRVGNFPPKPLDPASDLQAEWHLWREEQVARMVQQLDLGLAETKPELTLGAAVFRNEVNARNSKMQNWRHWANNRWLDFVAPMMYAATPQQLELWLDWESDGGSRRDMLYPILGLQSLRSPGGLFSQIGLLQERHIPGFSLFAVRRLDDKTLSWLAQGPFRTPAEAPHSNPTAAIRRQLITTADWLAGLKVPAADSLATAFRNRAGSLDPARLPDQVRELADGLNASGLKADIQRETMRQLDDALALAEIQAERQLKGSKLQAPTRPPSAVQAEARPLPGLTIPFLNSPPALDGQLDEPAWQPAARIPGLWWSTGSARPQVKTQVRLGYDAQNLYFGWNNEEPRPDRMVARADLDGSDAIANGSEDTVELFLSPGKDARNYYYFVLNAAGARFSRTSFDSAWRPEFEAYTARQSQGWNAELRIPFSSLRVPAPTAGGSWRGNLCRRRPQEIAPYHCWSFTFGGVHRIDRFGNLSFTPLPQPSPSPSAATP